MESTEEKDKKTRDTMLREAGADTDVFHRPLQSKL